MDMSTQEYRRDSRIYLDNAASTPITEEVIQEMIPYLTTYYGNPSSLHSFGYESNDGISLARKRLASVVGARPSEIIFTSSGTEADNIGIKGAAYCARRQNSRKNHIITSSIEHAAVLECCVDLERNGFTVSYLPVCRDGIVDADKLEKCISKERTSLVSIMLANNEIGTIQPIAELARIVRKKADDILFHADAIQALGKVPVNCNELGVDLMAFSSHKINGPKGVGGLYIKEGTKVEAVISGGGQEKHLRSGTENVPGIVGFGRACELASRRLDNTNSRVLLLRDHLVKKIIEEIPKVRINGPLGSDIGLPNIAHLTFLGLTGEDLLIKLDEHGVAASTGSACSARRHKESHVLRAIGLTPPEISGSLRLSLGPQNTIEEIDEVITILKEVVQELRELSPLKNTT